ncbi:G5 domain-containing protein [Promicromonospora sp. NPDC060271]|uniref:G5 domain-containing protein n=1 Tax=Promicromonospora sp. NPDC060271 TaxID=3347089 RepID=UPI003661F9DF
MTVADIANTRSEVMDTLPPGHPSGPMPVVATDGAGVATAPPPPPPPPPGPPRRRRGIVVLVSLATIALVGAGGVAVYGAAHKTVTLDVGGKITSVETFEGDVADLLTAQGVEVTGRDAVTPGLDGALRDGGTVVVRYGHKVAVWAEGKQRTAWVTALDADEALTQLSRGDGTVVLVPTRAEGRVTLPMPLDVDGPVHLAIGGEVRRVADGSVRLDELLAAQEAAVDSDDRVSVLHRDVRGQSEPVLTVLVKEVKATIEEVTSRIPYKTATTTDPGHYADLGPYLASAGVDGKRVTAWDVTRIDGKVVSKEKVNSWVGRAPVDKVIVYGTKERPKPKPEPKPKSKSDSKSDSRSDSKSGSGSDPEPRPTPKSEPDPRPKPDSKRDSD